MQNNNPDAGQSGRASRDLLRRISRLYRLFTYRQWVEMAVLTRSNQLQASQPMLCCVTTESCDLCGEKAFRRTGKKDIQQPMKEP